MKRLLGALLALLIASGALVASGPPVAAADIIDPTTASLTIWHGYGTGTPEEQAFQAVLASARPKFPNITFTVVVQPFGEIYSRFEASPASGPDLFIAPNDRLGAEVRAGLLADVTAAMSSRVGGLTPPALAGIRLSGRYWMVPESSKAVALYYRASRVAAAPLTTWALLNAVKGGMKLGFVANSYYAAGLYTAFGGRIIDSTYYCVADKTPGVAQAMDFLRQLVVAGAAAYELSTTRAMHDDFVAGRLDAIMDGNWLAGDYRTAFGADLRAVPLPLGPDNLSRPLVGVDGWSINARRSNASLATKVALALTDASAQASMMDAALHVPVAKSVAVVDPVVSGFAMQTLIGNVRPQGKGFEAYWTPFDTAVVSVVKNGANATTAVRTACSAMNAANGR